MYKNTGSMYKECCWICCCDYGYSFILLFNKTKFSLLLIFCILSILRQQKRLRSCIKFLLVLMLRKLKSTHLVRLKKEKVYRIWFLMNIMTTMKDLELISKGLVVWEVLFCLSRMIHFKRIPLLWSFLSIFNIWVL